MLAGQREDGGEDDGEDGGEAISTKSNDVYAADAITTPIMLCANF